MSCILVAVEVVNGNTSASHSLREEPSQKNNSLFIAAYACGFAGLRTPAKHWRNAFAAKVETALLSKSLHPKKKNVAHLGGVHRLFRHTHIIMVGYIIFIAIRVTSMAKRRSIFMPIEVSMLCGQLRFSPGSTMPLSASARRWRKNATWSV